VNKMFEGLLNPVFGPLLNLSPFWVVAIISALVSLIITIIYKFSTNQNLMKQLKDEMKELQKEMKELKNDPKKMMEVQTKAMQTNSKYMMQSMKSTLITFIPIILIFGWMNANIAFEPILPGQEFTITTMFNKAVGQVKLEAPEDIIIAGNATQEIINNKATWVLEGKEGDYKDEKAIKIVFNDRIEYKNLLITTKQAYYEPIKLISNSPLKSITVNQAQKRVIPFNFNFLGYKGGWLGTYIIVSMIVSMLLRKILKVY